MTIQKKSLISKLNTTKKAIVASAQAGTASVEPATKNLVKHSMANRSLAKKSMANRSFAKR